MEIRKVDQVKVYFILLNPMRSNSENRAMVAASFDPVKLESWYQDQKADATYKDVEEGFVFPQTNSPYPETPETKQWGKTFKKDSPLEWYNPIEWGMSRNEPLLNNDWVSVPPGADHQTHVQSVLPHGVHFVR